VKQYERRSANSIGTELIYKTKNQSQCRETTLTGEIPVSHLYPPGDLNPGPS
jgi:hypothetical protein